MGRPRELPRDPLRQREPAARRLLRRGPEHGGLHVLDRRPHARRRARDRAAAEPPDARPAARPHADADAVDRAELRRRRAVAVHVAERRRDRQQGPRRLHAPARRAADLAARREHDVGDRHPQRLARDPVRDDLLPRRAAGDAARAPRGGGDRRRRPVPALPLHHAAAAAAADRRPAAVRRHLRRLPVRDPLHHARVEPGPGRRSDDDPHLPAVLLQQPVRLRRRGLRAADGRDVRVGAVLVPRCSSATWRSHEPSAGQSRAGRPHVVRAVRDALADPVAGRVVAADRRPALARDLQPARAHVHGVQPDVADGRLRALPAQLADHLHDRGAVRDGVRQHRRLRARALQVPRRRRRCRSASSARS